MHPIIKNTLAVITGWLGGSAVNMGLIQVGHQFIPIEGIDPSNMDALAAVMPRIKQNVLGIRSYIDLIIPLTAMLSAIFTSFKISNSSINK